MRDLSVAELNAILLHELAHLRRWDDWTNFVQKILAAVFFFHPAVWWIEKKLALEREMACDDLVLAKTASPRAYAECLVSLAEKSLLRRGLSLAQAAVDRMRHISLRVSQILDVSRPSATQVWKPAPVLLAAASVVCLMALSYTPRLVSFENDAVMSSPLAANSVGPSRLDVSHVADQGLHIIQAKLELRPEASVPVGARSVVSGSVARRSLVPRMNKPAVIAAQAGPPPAEDPMPVRSASAARSRHSADSGCRDANRVCANSTIRDVGCGGLESVCVASNCNRSGTESDRAGNYRQVDLVFFAINN